MKGEEAAALHKKKWHGPAYDGDCRNCILREGRSLICKMEGCALHELQGPVEERDNWDSGANLSIIIEYYEMEDTGVVYTKEQESVMPLKNRPPPGWI